MFRSKSPIGVDIGARTVKLCQMRRVAGAVELEKLGVAEIYPSAEIPGDPQDQFNAKVAAVKRALELAHIKARRAASSICGESIIVRYLQLPEMPEDELKKALQWEAEEYIPFRLSEVNLDSAILGRSREGDHPKMDVLLVSAKKDLIENHQALLRAAGLESQIIDLDSFAFLNCFEVNHQPGPEDCVALVNIGSETTNLNIYSKGTSRFSRDILIGGETMTTAIRSRLNCGFGEAERMKLDYGASPAEELPEDLDVESEGSFAGALMDTIRGRVDKKNGGKAEEQEPADLLVRRSIKNVLDNLFSEVRRSIEFFENQYRGLNVKKLVLGGGTVKLDNLVENFAKELQLPVEVIDPFRQVRVTDRGDVANQVQLLRHQLGVGVGLGLRGLMAA